MRFGLDHLSQWTSDRRFTAERGQISAYAAATNETAPSLLAGDVAPPIFAIVPAWETIHEATAAVVPEEARPRVVHGEQDMRFHAPIRPGMELAARAAVVGVHPKSSGTTVVVKIEVRDGGDTLLNEQWVTEFYRGVVADEGSGEPAPDHRSPEGLSEREPLATVTYGIDDDQTFRYAEASGDHNVFHLDDAAAKAVGLPGIIVHGLCVMAFTGRAVLEAAAVDDPARLRRLAVRFSRPVFPGTALTTRVWQLGPDLVAYDALNEEGEAVIRDGLADLGAGSAA